MKDSNDGSTQNRILWAKICEDFMQRLNAYALRLANGRAYDAEDLVQETVCRALTYSVDPHLINNPLGYLLRMMHNLWITKWRKENSANMESLDELQSKEAQQRRVRSVEPAVESDVLRVLENDELKARMSAMQGPLTPREKLLLKLHLEHYTCKEIADKMNEDVRLIRSDLNAVRTKVRSRLMKAKVSGLPDGE